MGFAPTGKRRLCTAHARCGRFGQPSNFAVRSAHHAKPDPGVFSANAPSLTCCTSGFECTPVIANPLWPALCWTRAGAPRRPGASTTFSSTAPAEFQNFAPAGMPHFKPPPLTAPQAATAPASYSTGARNSCREHRQLLLNRLTSLRTGYPRVLFPSTVMVRLSIRPVGATSASHPPCQACQGDRGAIRHRCCAQTLRKLQIFDQCQYAPRAMR